MGGWEISSFSGEIEGVGVETDIEEEGISSLAEEAEAEYSLIILFYTRGGIRLRFGSGRARAFLPSDNPQLLRAVSAGKFKSIIPTKYLVHRIGQL